MEEALHMRFPETDIVDSQADLADFVELARRAIEEAGFDPGLPLDLRAV
jgi:AraC family transcriptional regulator of adaptative response/methylated-DNA-[protein]-cysteine methyltransferase